MKKNIVFRFCLAFIWFSLFAVQGNAQCSGNVLFKEDFGGSSSSPLSGPRLPASITSYAYDSLGLVDDGQYSIRRTTADIATGGRQFSTWHIGPDHSGSGYMMMVNADYTAGKFYETTVGNLCSGSKLYFSAWIANLIPAGNSNPLDPVLKFEIASATTGNVLATFFTNTVPRFSSFTWTQYGFNFTLPSGESSVVLRIYNNQAGGLGNDLCLDDIEFTLCGPAMTPAVTGLYSNTSDVCVGGNINIAGNVEQGYYSNQVYQWQFKSAAGNWTNIPGETTSFLSLNNVQLNNSGTYRLLVAESGLINSVNCRSVSPLIPINVYAPVIPVLQANQLICEKDTINISTATNALQYSWQHNLTTLPGNASQLTIPGAAVTDGGIYTLNTVTSGGCSSSSAITMVVQQNVLQRILPLNTLLCDAQTLDVDVQQPLATSYLWNDGSLQSQRTFAAAGTYSLLTSDGVCKRTDSFTITRNFTPASELGNDTTLCFYEPVTLNAANPIAEYYLWSNGSTDSSITVTDAGTYSVTVGNKCGFATDDRIITYQDCADQIFVPNAFTPNNDGLNDVLKAKAYFRVEEFSLSIYNRWGQKIFFSNSLFNGWDGKYKGQDSEQGNYIWTIQYKRNGKIYKQKGTVLVLY
ncbi:MAG: gliding motility-associated C-terminal domain-containing protein [Lacibacter sp.]